MQGTTMQGMWELAAPAQQGLFDPDAETPPAPGAANSGVEQPREALPSRRPG
jgi:hypothetical protein